MKLELVNARFQLGVVGATPGAIAAIEEASGFSHVIAIASLLAQHASGDWGIVCDEDKAANDWSLKNDARILSAYMVNDVKVWIITEADRSSTTILLPEEY